MENKNKLSLSELKKIAKKAGVKSLPPNATRVQVMNAIEKAQRKSRESRGEPVLPAYSMMEVMLRARADDLSNLCALNKGLREVCQMPYFWRERFEQEYGTYRTKIYDREIENLVKEMNNPNDECRRIFCFTRSGKKISNEREAEIHLRQVRAGEEMMLRQLERQLRQIPPSLREGPRNNYFRYQRRSREFMEKMLRCSALGKYCSDSISLAAMWRYIYLTHALGKRMGSSILFTLVMRGYFPDYDAYVEVLKMYGARQMFSKPGGPSKKIRVADPRVLQIAYKRDHILLSSPDMVAKVLIQRPDPKTTYISENHIVVDW